MDGDANLGSDTRSRSKRRWPRQPGWVAGLTLIALMATLAVSSIELARHGSARTPGAAPDESGDREPQPPLRVDAVAVNPEPLAEVVRATGTLLAAETVELMAETGGRITAIHFEEGRPVQAGDLLVKLQDADLRARLLATVHELELARRRERRTADLVAQSFVRQDEHDAALSSVHILEAEIALIEAQIGKTEIRAPFSGTAGLRRVSEGAVVDASTRIATVQRTDEMKVEFAVPERYARRVTIGSPIVFGVVGEDEQYEGHVYAFDPQIDMTTRTLSVRAVASNSNGELLPGAFASIELILERTEDALMIPAVALVPQLESPYVFLLVDGKAERRRIVTGMRTEDRVQVLSGLDPGDVVITTGLQELRAGARVDATIVDDARIATGVSTTTASGERRRAFAGDVAALPAARR